MDCLQMNLAEKVHCPAWEIERTSEDMEAGTVVLDTSPESRGPRGRAWQREAVVFIATLVVNFVWGYAPDLSGIIEGLMILVPLAGAFTSCFDNL